MLFVKYNTDCINNILMIIWLDEEEIISFY